MDILPSYPKIYSLGHPAIGNIFDGKVVVQEKVDGSQFSFGIFDGNLMIRSKGQQIFKEAPEGMFKAGVEHVTKIAHMLVPDWVYRGEYLQRPKHNALAYNRVPSGHIALFDILTGQETYATLGTLKLEAEKLGIELFADKLSDLFLGGNGSDRNQYLLKFTLFVFE